MATRTLTPGALLRAALSQPGSLTAGAASAMGTAPGIQLELSLAVTAALLYARPDLVTPKQTARVLDQCRRGPEPVTRAASQILEALPAMPLADQGWEQLVEALGAEQAAPAAAPTVAALTPPAAAAPAAPIVALLRAYAHWRPDLVSVDAVLTLAARPALRAHRPYLLHHVVGRLVHERPEAFDDAAVGRLLSLFRASPGLRYVLATLAGRRETAETVRRRLEEALRGEFPLRETAAAILGRAPIHTLAVLNVVVGQGDELTRLALLLQALLDGHPELRVTVITPRPYLYDSPRVHAVSTQDDLAVDAALRQRYDVVVDIEEPSWPTVVIRPELRARVHGLVERDQPGLVVRGNVGWNRFLYQSVVLGGVERVGSLGLDRPLAENIYDPCQRLLAELGLPERAGTEQALTPSLLVESASREAASVWATLVPRGRPVALVSPFGGHSAVKGYVERQAPLLAAELAGLVREGYGVVVLPNGTPWIRPPFLADIRAHLAPETSAMVVFAPDPAEPDPAKQLRLAERDELPYADRIMRLFKFFAAWADLVCTVEGWMAHLAYDLGRPFRLILMAQSHSFDWHPVGRDRAQRLSAGLSPLGPPYEETELLGEGRPAPLPRRPRKALLEQALAGLGLEGDATSVTLLRHAARSEDYDIRAAAVAALGRVRPLEPFRGPLIDALRDPEPVVQLPAALALLAAEVDCRRELGPRAEDVLRAHRDIVLQRWPAVLELGVAALPALGVTVNSANDVIRRESRLVARRILAPWTSPSARSVTAPGGDRPMGS